MGSIRYTWEGRSAQVPPEKALAWWFDLREDDHRTPEHAAMEKLRPGDGRTVLSRTADEVVVEDRYKGRKFPSTVRREPGALRVHSTMGSARLDASFRFLPDGTTTRIAAETTIEAPGLMGLMMGLMRGGFERKHRKDMDAHLHHMEREWKAQPW